MKDYFNFRYIFVNNVYGTKSLRLEHYKLLKNNRKYM